ADAISRSTTMNFAQSFSGDRRQSAPVAPTGYVVPRAREKQAPGVSGCYLRWPTMCPDRGSHPACPALLSSRGSNLCAVPAESSRRYSETFLARCAACEMPRYCPFSPLPSATCVLPSSAQEQDTGMLHCLHVHEPRVESMIWPTLPTGGNQMP